MSSSRFEKIEANLRDIQQRISDACARCGRDPSDVCLVAVTKSVEPEVAEMLIQAGALHLGENRVNEGERKIRFMEGRGTWHMIGHLQRNKVRKVLPIFSMIHSVDSLRLLKEISDQCVRKELSSDILLEVNVSGESTKYGFAPDQLDEAIKTAEALPGIALCGLMTMAPYSIDPEEARPYFRKLRSLLESKRQAGLAGEAFQYLSMGMTGDFETAVEEGATHVRIGTALFEGL